MTMAFFISAIILLWILITTTAIPVAITHGEVSHVWQEVNVSSCIFRFEEYNIVAFQVSEFKGYFFFVIDLKRLVSIAEYCSNDRTSNKNIKINFTRTILYTVCL